MSSLRTMVDAYINVLTGKAKAEGVVRLGICSGTLPGFTRCPYYIESIVNFCDHCKCPTAIKTRTLKQGECPIGKW